ncbi:MAG: TldD/PmbA family protein [Peptococcaceae bacterium]|nr:TldD/PmbA family protein [Peptococcaceae bacterium]
MLAKPLLEDILLAGLSTGGDFAEVFVEDRFSTILSMIGGKVDSGVSGRDYGIGVRILKGTNYVYAYTNDYSRDNLIKVAKEAAAAISPETISRNITLSFMKDEPLHINPIRIYPHEIVKQDKVSLMARAYHAAKEYDPVISQVMVRYFDEDQKVQIANSLGLYVEDERVRTRTAITAIASKGPEKQSGTYAPGAHMGFEFYDNIKIEDYAQEAARIASTMIHAPYAPSGRIPVIIDNEFGGVIFHEACGHSLEATSVAKKTSVFADKLGEKIASSVVSAVDDGTIPNAWGSLNVDDEGHVSQRNLLIEAGVLKGYMVDLYNGRRMNVPATGNSRRQSYKFAPTSRMTNTFILPGSHTREEIIASTEYGLFARYMGGGSVNPATGEFNFAVNEGYMVRNGKLAEPVRGATLIGQGSDVLLKIDMVADNLACGQGMCGSISGSLPADVGQPTIRVSEMIVGGRKGDK